MTVREQRSQGILTSREMMTESTLENVKQMLIQMSLEVQKCIDLLRKDRNETSQELQEIAKHRES